MNDLMTADEISSYLNISVKNVYTFANQGVLPAARIGSKWLFPKNLIDQWILDSAQKNIRRPLADEKNTLIAIGSNDFMWEILSNELYQYPHNLIVPHASVGSSGGLKALHEKRAHTAGIHLYDPSSQKYNLPFLRRFLPGHEVSLIHLFNRKQGLIVKKGNPKKINAIQDLARNDVVFINRKEGSGTRVLFDALIEKENIPIDQIKGYNTTVNTHLEVAFSISRDSADVGIGIEASAKIAGLDFIPIHDESYDIVILKEYIDLQPVKILLDFIKSNKFKNKIMHIGGYDLSNTCIPVWEGTVPV